MSENKKLHNGAVIVVSTYRMFRILSMVSLVIAWTGLQAVAAQDSDRFVRANEAYLQEKYQDAYKLYQEISNPTPRVYFNMGSCALKLSKTGQALWRLRQAEERWGIFDYEELQASLDQIYAKINVSTEKKGLVLKSRDLSRQGLRFIKAIPLGIMQLLFLLSWTLLFVLARKLLKKKRRGLLIMLFVSMFLLGGLLLYRQIRVMRLSAVVIEPRVVLYAGPSTTYQQVGVLVEGCEVRVDRNRPDFCKVKTKSQFGWVERSALGFI